MVSFTTKVIRPKIAPAINDSGAIVGTAAFSGTDTNIAPGSHGVLLLPCQLTLLNGDTNTNSRDGVLFDGTRPTTISATSPFNTHTTLDIGAQGTPGYANDGKDVLGVDKPLGRGRGDVPGQCYTYSLIVAAKVSPASANVTYTWGRTYMDRGVTIRKITTATNAYWYVQTVNSLSNPTGLPATPEWDTGTPLGYTFTPSANNLLCGYDNPAMNLAFFSSCSTNDYAYEKADYAYYLTNSIGSANAVATMHVGTKLIAKRLTTTGTIATDWSGISNTAGKKGDRYN